jgi:hypothetical protein
MGILTFGGVRCLGVVKFVSCFPNHSITGEPTSFDGRSQRQWEATVAHFRVQGLASRSAMTAKTRGELACSQATRAGGSMLCARGVGQ